jgi:hypothetical protein
MFYNKLVIFLIPNLLIVLYADPRAFTPSWWLQVGVDELRIKLPELFGFGFWPMIHLHLPYIIFSNPKNQKYLFVCLMIGYITFLFWLLC